MQTKFVDMTNAVTTRPICLYGLVRCQSIRHVVVGVFLRHTKHGSKTKSADTDSVGVVLVIRHELTIAQQVWLKTTMNSQHLIKHRRQSTCCWMPVSLHNSHIHHHATHNQPSLVNISDSHSSSDAETSHKLASM